MDVQAHPLGSLRAEIKKAATKQRSHAKYRMLIGLVQYDMLIGLVQYDKLIELVQYDMLIGLVQYDKLIELVQYKITNTRIRYSA